MISSRGRLFIVFAVLSLGLLILLITRSNDQQNNNELNAKAKAFVERIHTNRAYILAINLLNQPIEVNVGNHEGLKLEPRTTSRLMSHRLGSTRFNAKPQKGENISQDFPLKSGTINIFGLQQSNSKVTIKEISGSYVGVKEGLAQLCVLNFDPQNEPSYLIELYRANHNKTILKKVDALYNTVNFVDAEPGKYDVKAIKQSKFGKTETLLSIEFRRGTRYVFIVNGPLEPKAAKYVLTRMGPAFEVSQQGASGN